MKANKEVGNIIKITVASNGLVVEYMPPKHHLYGLLAGTDIRIFTNVADFAEWLKIYLGETNEPA